MKLTRWSHSTVDKLLNGCAWRVYLEKFVGLPRGTGVAAEVGTAYHAAVEEHEEQRRLWWYSGGRAGDVDGVPQSTMEAVAEGHLADCPVEWDAEEEGAYGEAVDMVTAAIDNWRHVSIPEGQPGEGGSLRDRVMGWRPVGVEARFEVWRPEVTSRPIVGYIDAVYYDPDDDIIIVVDHKSSKNLDRFPVDGKGKRPQATYYNRAVLDDPSLPALPSGPPRRFEYHVARTRTSDHHAFQAVRVVTVDVDDLDVKHQDTALRRADELVADGEFHKNPSWFLCDPRWCPHHKDGGGSCDPEGPPEFPVDVAGEPLPVLS